MSGETNLTKLLASMSPACDNMMYGFATLPSKDAQGLSFVPKCMFQEDEGITVIATIDQLVDNNQSGGYLLDHFGMIPLKYKLDF